MKYLILFLLSTPAFASESFNDGAARISYQFAQLRDQDERSGHKPMDPRPVHEYLGVAKATFQPNAPWTEMREATESFFRDYSREARIAWFEPLHEPDGRGGGTVTYPYIVKTDMAETLLPSYVKPLKELVILAIVRVDMEGSKWQIATEIADHDLYHWNQMLQKKDSLSIANYKSGALLIARYGDSAPGQGRWRLVEAYEFGKPSPSGPAFRELKKKAAPPVPTAKILKFPGCAKSVTK